jgi:hypothetical protein
MECRFRIGLCLAVAALLAGCVSLQVQKVRRGAAPAAPGASFAPGTTSLQDVLTRWGAPDEVVDLEPDVALHYRHTLQRGAEVSVGIPLKYVWMPNPSVEARSSLLRHDTAVLIFTAAGVLKDLRYERATDRPLMQDYW